MPGVTVPTVSVVTPSFNQVDLLAGVIANVQAQAGVDVEHIVIDGGSTDGTLDLLRDCGDAIIWVSEADAGQSHAINKGFARARGEVLGWLNCDDRYTPGALALVADLFAEDPTLPYLYGDAMGADSTGREYGLRAHVRSCTLDDLVHHGDPIVQPAAFWRRSLWAEAGTLDETLTYAFDYEYWMRVAGIVPLAYLPVCLAVESLHGAAKTATGEGKRMTEIAEVATRHGGDGIPYGFRAEAAAVEAWAAVRSAARGHASATRRHASAAIALHPPVVRHLLHLVARAVPGTSTVPRLRLVSNRVRTRRAPRYPVDVSGADARLLLVAGAPPARAPRR